MASQIRLLAVAAMAGMASAAAPAAATGAAAVAAKEAANKADDLNEQFYNYIFIVLASLIAALTIWRVVIESVKYVRTLTCLNNDTQRYFATPSSAFASLKKHVLYAPIFGKRHNREFQLSAAVNVGTLPTRFQLMFLLSYFATNVIFCVADISYGQPLTVVCTQIRNRSGILAVANMIPLFIMAARNNPLINWLNLSFDTFNLLHRWVGRIVVLEAVAHTVAWTVSKVSTSGWAAVGASITGSPLIMWGFIGTVSFVVISIQASSLLRHAFYETFKYLHIALAILAIIGLWFHLKIAGVPQMKLLYGVIALWVLERTVRIIILLYRNVGKGGSKTLVEALPGNAVRITVDLPRPWTFKPGQHAYLYMPSFGLFTSHPFTVAWSEETENPEGEKLAMNRQDVLAMKKTSLSFIVRARTGFTNTLFKKAEAAPSGRLYTKCYAEGPYGGMHMMHSYGTVMMFAGGVGITHQVPHVRDLVAGYANGVVAARKIVLVWIIQSPEHLEWIRPWMTSILAMDKRRDVLRIMLFVSRPRSTKEIHSPSATVQMFPGRPNIDTLMDIEMENQVGAMGVSVCGGGSLSDDVRRAVRMRQHAGNIDFVEEAFSW
ncbi:Ferredoxin reductase-like, C-terminal NADP-linked [Venustampulla echinocandica]|uniref:ferric-chelate reductase (NADPH) n=1 Tax=Venustampulla echinocandica TaxID=2656787 RepID=A0A370TYB1_9HELO|nr:Ferredoxin reductase-like, C-terminal NADP-linked [Venustampulla echinocandica]RDL40516.1 Ferredoxin reductase-like, C-terminal NADP-linked [Venustampulla echinocandica]